MDGWVRDRSTRRGKMRGEKANFEIVVSYVYSMENLLGDFLISISKNVFLF